MTNLESAPGAEVATSTMFLMDYRLRVSSQSYVIRLQQPRVLVVPDFLLAVGEFFVPALGAITGREELMDPISRNKSIVLSGPVHKLIEDVRTFLNSMNGSLLRRYTYLSNDSSYSILREDGVEILLLDESSYANDEKSLDYMDETSDTSDTSAYTRSDSSKTQSFTFEAQVVSPEFTFYDGTKSYVGDFTHGEKLLRAKMDLSFM
ncbi:uncharacterized protein LOC117914069 isoform X1 [Vitis riparia]|uniref:uncharacterized protein LOC117914069 isoform X1 n=1 Tax=Vitis riparia TaxID=96939 RepID=UPI00155A6940|nr:uncharacterized protein LOC117914069 isoform X1 [Vitis riparia]